jgi:aromatic-L-amino-acid/L-tryptophan decarboxylase
MGGPVVEQSLGGGQGREAEVELEETLDPADWEAFRGVAHRALDRILDLQRGIRGEPAWRAVPEGVEERYREGRPLQGAGAAAVYDEFLELVLPYYTGTLHPRFWGWAGGQGSPMGMLAEMLGSGLNMVPGNFDDAGSRVERQVIEWMKDGLGYPSGGSGVLTSGGSVANLVGLVVARDAAGGWDVSETGVHAGGRRLVMYGSSEVHASVFKAAKVMGLGVGGVRVVPVDAEFRMRLDALEAMIREDREASLAPFAVVGTAGTINSGSIDDLEGLAEIAAREDLWFHVDGAFGAMAALSPRTRGRVRGMERADSLAFDFHKWMYIPYEAGCVLIRDGAAHRHSFTVAASYLKPLTRGPGSWPDPADRRGPQLSRGFKALKVWMSLKEQGFDKYGRLVSQNVDQAAYLADRIDRSSNLRRVAPVALNVVVFRYEVPEADGDTLDDLNRELLMRIQERGIAIPSSTILNGAFVIRVCICNHRSRRADFDALVVALEEIGAEVRAELRL